jgi:ferredoxin-NADP reductase
MPYQSKLLHRAEVAYQTISIQVERPSGFTFEVGQFVDLGVPDRAADDPQGPSRSLSIASAPGAGHLEFLMRLRDTPYKRALATMPIGAPLVIEGPFDDFLLPARSWRELVFIAGGIGIAPFLSVLRDAAAERRELRVTLFYSNRRPEDTVALDELRGLQSEIPGFRLVATMTRAAESALGWEGETEHLGIGLFERYLPDVVGPDYYISGAPTLISELRMALLGAGVANDAVRIELFTGY